MREVDARLDALANRDQDATGSFRIPTDIRGQVAVRDSAQLTVTFNRNSSHQQTIQMSSIVYEASDGTRVAYEGGGVWKQTASGSIMLSPPEIQYREGRLDLALNSLVGDITDSGSIEARYEAAESRNRSQRFRRALYNGSAINTPQDVENVTLTITGSEYASAWHRYARDTFDSTRVTVLPASGSVAPGDTVTMRFAVGQVARPRYVVDTIDAPASALPSDDVWLNATVRNTGNLSGNQTVTYELRDSGGNVVSTDQVDDVVIGGGSTKTLAFPLDPSTLSAGSFNYTIDTGNDTVTREIVVGAPGDDRANLSVQSITADTGFQENEDATLQATIENTGDLPSDRPVTVTFTNATTGNVVDTQAVSLGKMDGGDAQTVSVAVPTGRPGLYAYEVATGDDTASGTFAVGDAARFDVDISAPTTVAKGSTTFVDVSIENIGSLQDTQTVTYRFNGSTERTESVTIGSGDTWTQQFAIPSDEVGSFDLSVASADDREVGSVVVTEGTQPNFLVTGTDAAPDPIRQTQTLTVSADVTNIGAEDGTQTIDFSFDGVSRDTGTLSLDSGEMGTATFTYEVPQSLDPGMYDYTVETANASLSGSVQVVNETVIDEGDGEISVRYAATVNMTVMGAEISAMSPDSGPCTDRRGNNCFDYENRIYNSRWVTIGFLAENATWSQQYNPWQDTNLNAETNEADIINGEYQRNFTLPGNSSVTVRATSYQCGDLVYAGITEQYYGEEWEHIDCQPNGNLYSPLAINENTNPSNVIIRGDGDPTPSLNTGYIEQRGLKAMLGDYIHESNQTFDLGPNERVFLFELTERNADPDEATASGDPDYNDAVVLFRLEDINETRSVSSDYVDFRVADLDAPASVDQGDPATVTANLTNVGDVVDDQDVQYRLVDDSGTTVDSGAVSDLELGPDESATRDFTVDTSTPGTYEYVVSTENDTERGLIYVGGTAGDKFLVTELDGPRYAKYQGSNEQATAVIENVGDTGGTQTVEFEFGATTEDSRTVTLASGERRSLTFDIPTDTRGTFDYTVSTADSQLTKTVTVGESNFQITDERLPQAIYQNDSAILTAAIDNVGTIEDTQTVTLEVDGSVADTQAIQIGPDEPAGRVDLSIPTDTVGTFDYTLSTEDDSIRGTITVLPESNVDQNVSAPERFTVDMNRIVIDQADD
jgi:hypothetical protein